MLVSALSIDNSRARKAGQYSDQKVLLKYKNKRGISINLGKIELRNDSDTYYREV